MATQNETRTILDRLARDATPVRPLWSPGLRILLWSLGQMVFAAYIVSLGARPDLHQQLASPTYLVEMLLLIAAVLLLARAALGAAVPGDERWAAARLGAAATLVGGVVVVLRAPDTTHSIASFVATGFPCALHTALLSLLPTAWLLIAAYRGYPLAPARAGAVAGGAGFVFGFALMRLLCGADEPLHIVTWHWLPVAVGSIVAAAAGFVLFTRRSSPT